MTDFILIEGDKANFIPTFGAAVVTVQPGDLIASGPATLNGKKVCVDGDEKDVEVSNCPYFAGQYSIPGTGTLSIETLGNDQIADKTSTGNKAVLLKGSLFTATFKVDSQAKQPPPGPGSPIPDPTPQYSGQGQFTTANTKFQGS